MALRRSSAPAARSWAQRLFRWRRPLLWGLVLLTLAALWPAAHIEPDLDPARQLPVEHPLVQTYLAHRGTFSDANRLVVAVHARQGSIWTAEGLRRLLLVTEALRLLPGVERSHVVSLWTPNVFVTDVSTQGFEAAPLISGDITPERLNDTAVALVRERTERGGYIGQLVSRDGRSALVVADLQERAADGRPLDHAAIGHALEHKIRRTYEDAQFEVQVIGYSKAISDITDFAGQAAGFALLVLAITAACVWLQVRHMVLAALPIGCSLASLVWQLAAMKLLGIGLDPLAMVVPLLVFSIGVSHGVQQVSGIVDAVGAGSSPYRAARRGFVRLLGPGVLALGTAAASFATLALVPITAVREVGLAAALGVSFKLVSNLLMLPLAASLLSVSPQRREQWRSLQSRRSALRWREALLAACASLTRPKRAITASLVLVLLAAAAAGYGTGRSVGSLRAGVAELHPDARFNRDARDIAGRFEFGLDLLTVVAEVGSSADPGPCHRPEAMAYLDRLEARWAQWPEVVSTASLAGVVRLSHAALHEGLPRMASIPQEGRSLAAQIATLNHQVARLASEDCSVQGIHLYLRDLTSATLSPLISRLQEDLAQEQGSVTAVTLRLGGGSGAVQAATDQTLQSAEPTMLAWVYGVIVVLVLGVWRSPLALLACFAPLTMATAFGYALMRGLGLGLTVGTLPVLVLACGIGVDYAFYLFAALRSRQARPSTQAPQTHSTEQQMLAALRASAVPTAFTALTLAASTGCWAFSGLKFQSDMGLLLGLMFLVSLFTTLVVLPAMVGVHAVLARRWAAAGLGMAKAAP